MFDWPHRQRVLPRDLEGYKQLYVDTLDCLEDKCAELAALRAENERLVPLEDYVRDLCLEDCGTTWQYCDGARTPIPCERWHRLRATARHPE